MMKIQKGIVKYKDRNDIVCTYGITDDGKQYYFLGGEDKPLNNGYRIASTALVEAIDPMVKASNVGLIDAEGKEIIPFDNKSIKLINDDIILVEKAQPISESVLKAISLKNDPTEAAKLVSTPATIKGKLNAEMGPEGRYFFNDQFSAATVCDINGNNLVNDEYFSFIGMANGKLYFSKNTVDSEISEYSVLPPEVQSDVTPASDTNEIDVSKIEVSPDVVENALNNEVVSGVDTVVPNEDSTENSQEENEHDDEVAAESTDDVQTIPVVDEADDVAEDSDVEDDSKDSEEAGNDDFDIKVEEESDLAEEVVNENDDISVDDFEESESKDVDIENADENAVDTKIDAVDEAVVNASEKDEEVSESTEENDEANETSQEENDLVAFANSVVLPDETSKETIDDKTSEDDTEVEEVVSEEEKSFEDEIADSVFKDSILKADTLIKEDNFEERFDETEESNVVNDNIMTDIANSMNSLINLNKKQKEAISQYKDKLDKMNLTKRGMELKLTTLESKNKALEEKLHEQERIIASQAKELDEIRPQLAGKDELVKLLADAQVLLGQDTYDYDDNDSYYKKVA